MNWKTYRTISLIGVSIVIPLFLAWVYVLIAF